MSPKRVFETMTDEQLSEMALSLIDHSINREDFHRLCCWLARGIELTDNPPDGTLTLLMGLSGPVTHTQRTLLQVALFKWIGVLQTFVLDYNNNLLLAAGNPRQELLPLSL